MPVIFSNHVLKVICDNVDCQKERSAQGKSLKECRSLLRKVGWVFIPNTSDRSKDKTYCSTKCIDENL